MIMFLSWEVKEWDKLSIIGVVMLKKELLDILVCPKCKGQLDYNNKDNRLICNNCRLKYPIKNDIPVMLINEAEKF